MRMRLMLVLCGLCALSVGVATAYADKGRNNDNAKQCQKGGWQTLYTDGGTSFASEQECVSYAAQGGTLTTKTKSQLDCESFSGTFAPRLAHWTCTGVPPASAPDAKPVLTGDCTADGGASIIGLHPEGIIDVYCV